MYIKPIKSIRESHPVATTCRTCPSNRGVRNLVDEDPLFLCYVPLPKPLSLALFGRRRGSDSVSGQPSPSLELLDWHLGFRSYRVSPKRADFHKVDVIGF